ncbi:hypothetical protein B0F90DRAFT_674759 [Multifurca ochricompacta]|uniref:Uncharacterized protein n=1 Tax=Multifurca ochricompacta TaxID=376703 RepID=A0AAD4QLB6_9AGAM|nr:hypothetical protein B0F90DRAFT_674759 [Multifurca ochricompacta]
MIKYGHLPNHDDRSLPPAPMTVPISYLPGSDPYALDSYHIYNGGPNAWRIVHAFVTSFFFFLVQSDNRIDRNGAGLLTASNALEYGQASRQKGPLFQILFIYMPHIRCL